MKIPVLNALFVLAFAAAAMAQSKPPESSSVYAPVDYGAKCDGRKDDSGAFARAVNDARNTGGIVLVPAAGRPCLLATGINLPNGVVLRGVGSRNFVGFSAKANDWGSRGSWIKCGDRTRPCVELNGHGAAVEGVNFIYDQPVPGSTFAPTVYPYTIKLDGSFQHISNVQIVGATHGIFWAPSWNGAACTSGGGSGSYLEHVYISAFQVGVYMNCLNDEPVINDVQVVNSYYATAASVATYLEQHLTGFDFHYVDNAIISGIQVYLARTGFAFTDGTVLGNTHSFFNGRMTNIDQNIGDAAMKVNGNATVWGQIANLVQQQDTGEHNASDHCLNQLQSPNLNLSIVDFRVNDAGGSVICLNGKLSVGGLWQIRRYAAVAHGRAAIVMDEKAMLLVPGLKDWTRIPGTQTIAGKGAGQAGVRTGNGYTRNWVARPGEMKANGLGQIRALTAEDRFVPGAGGHTQARLTGHYTITAAAGGDATLSIQHFPEIRTGLSCAKTGSFDFDTNYLEYDSPLSNPLGALDLAAPRGCAISFDALAFQSR